MYASVSHRCVKRGAWQSSSPVDTHVGAGAEVVTLLEVGSLGGHGSGEDGRGGGEGGEGVGDKLHFDREKDG